MTPQTAAEGLSSQDVEQLAKHGISQAEARRQLELLRHPPAPLHLDRPATIGDGIQRIPEAQHPSLLQRYSAAAAAGRASKFVPASGAASRMFRSLIPYCSGARTTAPAAEDPTVQRFLSNLRHLAFFPAVAEFLEDSGLREKEGISLSRLCDGDCTGDGAEDRAEAFLKALLAPQGMNYANAPKALIPFHRYSTGTRTAFEEQLAEAADTITDATGRCRLHFTVVAEAEADFRILAERAQSWIRDRQGAAVRELEISYSAQSPATDTLAVSPSGQPFRLSDGRLLLRPGGHGSLLRNLGSYGGDVVFVKNIDNVVPDSRKGPTLLWKKILGGYLFELQERIFGVLRQLDNGHLATSPPASVHPGAESDLDDAISSLLTEVLGVDPQTIPEDRSERHAFTHKRLSRPLRVCGVVVNQGEPGGGPYWVRGSDGAISLQIVEGAQIDIRDPSQAAALQNATHFNPVDLVCGLRDHRGQQFDLEQYLDPTSAFIAAKSHGGRPLKALEHPGLWNGAMAHWNTVFVEVPAETFAPVKTVFDLLRPEHQS